MTEVRRQRLDEIGFVWDQLGTDWEDGFGYLKLYKEREGHCRVPNLYKENDYRLGQWVEVQRRNKAKMTEVRRQRLDEIGFVWDQLGTDWEDGFGNLKLYKEREGHCRVPSGYKEDGYRLGQWVQVQRQYKARMTEVRQIRLDELGFVWDPITADWEQGFGALRRCKEREGHCRVPQGSIESDYRLGQWVRVQRRNKAKMTEVRRQRLDEIGFVWDQLATDWEDGFHCLRMYTEREGHELSPNLGDGRGQAAAA
jgi:hypothetical protein